MTDSQEITPHTPGPWSTDAELAHESVLDYKGKLVADCCILFPDGGRTPDENYANARLIAAAPDLLAALEEVLSTAGGCAGFYEMAVDNAEDIIAKVKGAKC